MIRKRTRPQSSIREKPLEGEEGANSEDEEVPPLTDLIELQKLRKARQGIDSSKLSKGDARKRAKLLAGGGVLKKGAPVPGGEDENDKDAKARRVIRGNNFTQQTNALDVDKHMMAYIEQNLKIRNKPWEVSEEGDNGDDPQEDLYPINDRWKANKRAGDEGNVTNSLTMLTAIPEVDLGMDSRLKNIEDTEKAKRLVAEERQERRQRGDEEHIAGSRFYRPNVNQKSDAEILRDAKLEAMGISSQNDQPRRPYHERNQMATDEIVMERFKKRMRK